MSEFNITIPGGESKRLKTGGKYCPEDILVTAEGGGNSANYENALLDGSLTEYTNDSVTALRASAFRIYTSLEKISLPNVTYIDGDAFYGCSALREVNLPKMSNGGTYIFRGTAIVDIVLPLLKTLRNYTFYTCESLNSVDLPSCTRVNQRGFEQSTLSALILRGNTLATLDNVNAFNDTPIQSGTGYIYVPSALIDSYKAATNWTTYAAQFKALENYTVDGTTTGALDATKI